jgi:Flp pilus assembly protein TadG
MTRLRRLSGVRRPGHRRERGQALVEFAFTLPVFALFVFVVFQLGLVFVAYYSQTRMARETARWLAVNRLATDLQVAQHVQNTMLPGLVGNTPSLVTAGNSTTDTVYNVGQMKLTFSPCYKTGSSSGGCDHNQRAPAGTLHVQMQYDVSNILFLPPTFYFGNLRVGLPSQLPVYWVYVMVE